MRNCKLDSYAVIAMLIFKAYESIYFCYLSAKANIMVYKYLVAVCFILLGLTTVQGQSDVPDVTSTFAIKNANVVVRPGQVLEKATVIIKDGLIESVGQNVTIPFDAEIIEADSMFVYSGFIAAISHTGIPKAEEKKGGPDRSIKRHNPPNDAAGITPEKTVRPLLNASDKSIKSMRKLGFTMAHVVPNGRMMAGKGSIISLSGESVDELLIQENMSLFGSLLASQTRVYPATTIGVMSKWRQLYKQAELATQHEKKFKSNPSGIKRPMFDEATKALYEVTNKSLPVFFHAPKTLDMSRALVLQEELGFKMIAANTKQAYKLTNKLKAKNIPVIISLSLPKEDSSDNKEKADKKEEVNEEMKALMEKAKQVKAEYTAQAAMLEKENIPFAISLIDVKTADIQKNLRRMIKSGLSEDAALAALTTNPAKLLGVSSMTGTVERGKLANLIVTDTSYFKENANIKYVFVDGKKYKQEIKEKKKKSGDPDAVVDLSGSWSVSIDAQGMLISGNIEIQKDGESYSGTMTTDMDDEETELESIEVDGSEVTIKMTADVDGSQAPVLIEIVVEEDDFEGDVNIANGMMTAEITGSRTSTPKH